MLLIEHYPAPAEQSYLSAELPYTFEEILGCDPGRHWDVAQPDRPRKWRTRNPVPLHWPAAVG